MPPTPALHAGDRPSDTTPGPSPLDWAAHRLERTRSQGLERRPRLREGGSDIHSTVDGRRVVVFSGNDYLGLAVHPAVIRAAADAALALGVGSSGSRHLSGCHAEIGLLEEEAASFLRCGAATLAPSGHAANLAILGALGGRDAVIFSDERNHASIVDGCRLSRSRVEVYRHRDLDDLGHRLGTADGRPIIVSDTVFSVDGTCADVRGLRRLAEHHGAWLVLDEAHAVGTVGDDGRGAALAAGIDGADPTLVRIVTLSKALGASGAVICGAPEVRRLLLQQGRALIYSTALPHPIVAAARAAFLVLRTEPQRVAALQSRSVRLHSRLLALDPGGQAPLPVITVPISDPWRALEVEARLLDAGYLAQAVRPPTVPLGETRIRLCVSAAHTDAEIDGVAGALTGILAAPERTGTTP